MIAINRTEHAVLRAIALHSGLLRRLDLAYLLVGAHRPLRTPRPEVEAVVATSPLFGALPEGLEDDGDGDFSPSTDWLNDTLSPALHVLQAEGLVMRHLWVPTPTWEITERGRRVLAEFEAAA
jgi:hypothetical protein